MYSHIVTELGIIQIEVNHEKPAPQNKPESVAEWPPAQLLGGRMPTGPDEGQRNGTEGFLRIVTRSNTCMYMYSSDSCGLTEILPST